MTFYSENELLSYLLSLAPGMDEFVYGEVSQELVDQLPEDFIVAYTPTLQLTYFYREENEPRP